MSSTEPMISFLRRMTALVDQHVPEAQMLAEVPRALQSLIVTNTWLPPALAAPHPDHYQQYLLYCDPAARFSVVSFVWGPGQATPIHDHTVWGAVGQLRGREISTNYKMSAGGLEVSGMDTLEMGQTISFSPVGGDIHQVKNGADDVSVSIHVYGADIGRVQRHVYDPATGTATTFISGYSPAPVPNWVI